MGLAAFPSKPTIKDTLQKRTLVSFTGNLHASLFAPRESGFPNYMGVFVLRSRTPLNDGFSFEISPKQGYQLLKRRISAQTKVFSFVF